MPSNHIILCRPLLLLPSIFPSIRVFSNESALHIRWPKYWSFSFNISPSNEHPGLISFRMDRLDLLAVQGALRSLLGACNYELFKEESITFFSLIWTEGDNSSLSFLLTFDCHCHQIHIMNGSSDCILIEVRI